MDSMVWYQLEIYSQRVNPGVILQKIRTLRKEPAKYCCLLLWNLIRMFDAKDEELSSGQKFDTTAAVVTVN